MKEALKKLVRGTVHEMLGPMERRLLRQHETPMYPAVFILGAPRSGTSLFYELLVMRYQLAYFTNLSHRFYRTPSAATRLGRRVIEGYRASYQSDYGHIDGWGAPNEGGWIWQRWLVDGDWQDETMLETVAADEMRATLAAQMALFEAPFVNKNVMHANRVRLLDALLPGCLFIEVRRNVADTARSIIRAQQHHKGPMPDPQAWWSVRPSNARAADLITRAVLQVAGVSEDIARDTRHTGQDRLYIVEYEALCSDVESVLRGVASFLRRHGVPVADRAVVPARFDLMPSRLLEGAQEDTLQAALQDG